MRMQGNPDRPVVVTGKADGQGVAFNRNLPYGKYEMTIKVPERDAAYWSATLRDILLEFGGSYEQKIVAPTPEKRATVKRPYRLQPSRAQGAAVWKAIRARQGSFLRYCLFSRTWQARRPVRAFSNPGKWDHERGPLHDDAGDAGHQAAQRRDA